MNFNVFVKLLIVSLCIAFFFTGFYFFSTNPEYEAVLSVHKNLQEVSRRSSQAAFEECYKLLFRVYEQQLFQAYRTKEIPDFKDPKPSALMQKPFDFMPEDFKYQLEVRVSLGKNDTSMICCHGFGGNSDAIIKKIRPYTSDNLLGFNFKDANFSHETGDDRKTLFATPLDSLPLLYILKQVIVKQGLSKITLYGHGAGASTIILTIDLLNSNAHDALLKQCGITKDDQQRILAILQKGTIILDAPFRNIDEQIKRYGATEILLMYKYRQSRHGILAPTETLKKLNNLHLNAIVFFDARDEDVGTTGDSEFAKNLLDSNRNGMTLVLKHAEGGHYGIHQTLWNVYASLQQPAYHK